MPSWGIHLKLAKKLNENLKLDNDLFTFGNLIPDVDDDSTYTRSNSHYYTGIKFEKCPDESKIDLEKFKNDYKNRLTNPLIIGYLCHILTDEFYNEYIYINKWIQDENNHVVGIKCNNGDIIDVSSNFRESLKYKHGDLELYARYIYNYEELFIPSNFDIIYKNSNILNDNFYSDEDIKNKLKYLNDGEFKKFNMLTETEIINKDNYVLFSKEELDSLFNDCYEYIISELKKMNIK